jgi:hypothetical protein
MAWALLILYGSLLCVSPGSGRRWLLLAANPEWMDETGETLPQFLDAFEALIIAAAMVSERPGA